MVILLSILKISGIVLLCLIGLLLLLLLLLLLVPVRYRINLSKAENINGFISVSWFLSFIQLKALYNNGFNIILRILGISVYDRIKKSQKKSKKENIIDSEFSNENEPNSNRNLEINHESNSSKKADNESKSYNDDILSDDDIKDQITEEPKEDPQVDPQVEPQVDPQEDPEKDSQSTGNDSDNSSPTSRNSSKRKDDTKIAGILSKLKNILQKGIDFAINLPEKIDDFFEHLSDRIEKIIDTYEYYDTLLNKKGSIYAIELLKAEIIKLLKHICPKYCKINLDYSTCKAIDYGKAMEYQALLYPFLSKDSQVNIDYCEKEEDKSLSFETVIKGRIYLGYIGIIVLKVFFDKRVRIFLKLLKKRG